MPFSACALKKNIFLDVDIGVKNKSKLACTPYQQQVGAITRFPNIVFVWFLHIKHNCKSFENKSLTCTGSSFA